MRCRLRNLLQFQPHLFCALRALPPALPASPGGRRGWRASADCLCARVCAPRISRPRHFSRADCPMPALKGPHPEVHVPCVVLCANWCCGGRVVVPALVFGRLFRPLRADVSSRQWCRSGLLLIAWARRSQNLGLCPFDRPVMGSVSGMPRLWQNAQSFTCHSRPRVARLGGGAGPFHRSAGRLSRSIQLWLRGVPSPLEPPAFPAGAVRGVNVGAWPA